MKALLLWVLLLSPLAAQDAASFYSDKSYAQAAALWQKELSETKPDSAKFRELTFRVADAQWRALNGSNTNDETVFDPCLKTLRRLAEEPAERWGAEANESLGDFHFLRSTWQRQLIGSAQTYYLAALDYWSKQDASEMARQRYLAIVFRPLDRMKDDYVRNYFQQLWPLNICENAAQLAKSNDETAQAQFLLAKAMSTQGGPVTPARWEQLRRAFAAALLVGKKTDWYDDALWSAAQWMEYQGRVIETAPGQYSQQPDEAGAVKLYKRLTTEFSKGESRWRDQAQTRLKELTDTQLNVNLGNAFLPGSPIEFGLSARNAGKTTLTIAKLDLAKAFTATDEKEFNPYNWRQRRGSGRGEVVKTWTESLTPSRLYEAMNKVVRTDALPVGAYWLEAESSGTTSGAVLLVTQANVSCVAGKDKRLLFTCDAISGAPLPKAQVQIFRYYRNRDLTQCQTLSAVTDADGTATLALSELPKDSYEQGLTVLANANGQPALISQANGYNQSRVWEKGRTLVYTDRPAYRPGDTAQFKLIHRDYDGAVYSLTPGLPLHVRVNDPRGTKLLEKTYPLNEFGSAADSFVVPKDAPLGVYQMQVWIEKDNQTVYSAYQELFRLEEYKLPEFRVTVKMPEKDGRPQTFRKGDKVQALVKVEYYSGGPVPNAEVEYDLHQSPYYGDNPWPQPYPWLYQNLRCSVPWMSFWRNESSGQFLKREKVKTDAKGLALIPIETTNTQPGQDWQYRIEARVTDSSRRMVSGSGSVKVTETPFRFHLKPESQVYAPGSAAKIEIKALDANASPQQVKATVVITREVYVEKSRTSKKTGKKRVTFVGYDAKEIERREVATDAEGRLILNFTPKETGYYRVKILSPPFVANAKTDAPAPDRVIGETTLFVADAKTQDLGYRAGVLQLFPDKPTYRVGETAHVIVVSPFAESTALLCVQGDDLISHQVVRMNGLVKLLDIPVTEAFEPNIFFNGLMIHDSQVMLATEEVVVPPDEHFLKVTVTPDATKKKPGEAGSQKIQVTDRDGKPVSAEVSLGVVDASIYYIQSDLAADIRQFFYGEKRFLQTQPQSMLNELQLRKIDLEEDGEEVVRTVGRTADFDDRFETKIESTSGWNEGNSFGLAAGGFSKGKSARGMAVSAPASASNAMLADQRQVEASTLSADAPMDKMSLGLERKPKDGIAGEPNEPALVVRSDFRATAFWSPSIKTDAKGEATVPVPYPQSLTEWKAIARAVTTGSQFGFGETIVNTSQPLMARLQVPRFVVERDTVTLSTVVNNESDTDSIVSVTLEATNLDPVDAGNLKGTVPAHGQKRFDRVFRVTKTSGMAEVSTSAKSSLGSDAITLSVPIVEHGIEKFIARSEVLEAKDNQPASTEFLLDLPAQRNPGTTSLQLQFAPSLASTCLDALPYLARYPYGCVEQTMSRFLPAAVAAKTLRDLNIETEVVASRLFGGIEKGSAEALGMTKGDLKQIDAMVVKGRERLADFQHDDGGWGWWKQDKSDDFMTAYVVQGLALAKQAGIEIENDRMQRGAQYLRQRLVEYENEPSMAAWMLYAIGLSQLNWEGTCDKAADRVWNHRDELNAYTRSLLALAFQAHALDHLDYAKRAKILVDNLENGVKETKAESTVIGTKGSATMPTTCHWGEDGVTYRWSDGGIEATAFALRAMLAIDPLNPRIDQAARWLINNRRGAQWKNTRDTAIVILSLLEYVKQKQELEPKLTASILVNGREVKSVSFSAATALGVLNLELPESALTSGPNRVTIKVTGRGRLYASSALRYFTKEEPVTAAGNEIYVKREYYRETTQPMLLGGLRIVTTPLKDGDTLKSGDRIEVRLLIEAKNHYDYLLFEDQKPAGAEAEQVRSGEPLFTKWQKSDGTFSDDGSFVYQELRDRQVCCFITHLKQGVHEIRYKLRAETPGQFHALPVMGHAMYVPEIRANSDETRFTIQD